ncbi:MAG: peptidylprolyl isomerase, partial [Thermodesulfobacteriota bacterium]
MADLSKSMKGLFLFICAAAAFYLFMTLMPRTEDLPVQTREVPHAVRAGGAYEPTVAAIVNGKEIPMEELSFYIEGELKRAEELGQEITPYIERAVRTGWIERAVTRELLYQRAVSESIEVPDSELREALASPKYSRGNMPPNKLEEFVRVDLMINKLIDVHVLSKVPVSDEDVKNYYEDNPEEFGEPEQIRARHILIEVKPSDSQEEKEKARKKAETVLAEARDAKSDFAKLAVKYSEGPSGERGGDLGYFSREDMVPPFEEAAFAMKPGEVSDVVETRFGYHIIKLEDRKEATTIPLSGIMEQVRFFLKYREGSKEVEEWIAVLRSEAEVKIIEPAGTQQGAPQMEGHGELATGTVEPKSSAHSA